MIKDLYQKIWPLLAGMAIVLLLVVTPAIPSAYAASLNQARKNAVDHVVLLHGLGRSKLAMWPLALRLRKAGYRVELISYRSRRDTFDLILKDIDRQFEACCVDKPGKVHFVGHSLGGVMVRAYLAKRRVPNLGRVVLLGTPNGGSGVIDYLKDEWWFSLLGPTARGIGTGADNYPGTIGPPHYPLGIIAGRFKFLPNQRMLPGDDDGLVTVEATKVKGMTDFVVVETRHAGLRFNGEAASQVVNFLKTERFDHTLRSSAERSESGIFTSR